MYVRKRFVPRQQNETSSSRRTLNETNTCADSLSMVHLNASVGMWNYYIFYASVLEKLLSVCREYVTPETVPIQRDDRRTERNSSTKLLYISTAYIWYISKLITETKIVTRRVSGDRHCMRIWWSNESPQLVPFQHNKSMTCRKTRTNVLHT